MPSENGLKWQTSHDTELHESQKDLSSIGARCGVKMLFQSYNRPCRWLHLKQWILNYIDIRPSPHFKNLTCKMGLSAKLFLWKSLSRQNPCDCLRFKTGALFALNMAYYLSFFYYPQLKYDLILYFLTFPYDEQESSKFASRPSCALLA